MDGFPAVHPRFQRAPTLVKYEIHGVRLQVLSFCWTGKAHIQDGSECQDRVGSFPDPLEDRAPISFTAVVADGVSTEKFAAKGAELACETIGELFSGTDLVGHKCSARFTEAQARFVKKCREDKTQRESEIEVPRDDTSEPSSIVEYATTALVLSTDGKNYWAASVGDGAIYGISDAGSVARRLTEIRREGFVNEVRPFTSVDWNLGFSQSAEGLTALNELEGFCIMTDGLSESVGDSNAYFKAVWPELRQRLGNLEDLLEYAEAFCQYWEDRKFSDDDKTMVAIFIDP
jgi:hypothetical protein